MAETAPLLEEKIDIPLGECEVFKSFPYSNTYSLLAKFTTAIRDPRGRRPQAIAHRGYKAAFPENTMGAFKGAVEVKAHAIGQ